MLVAFPVGRVPDCAERKKKPDTDLSAFSPALRSCSAADLQGFSTVPKAGIQSLRVCFGRTASPHPRLGLRVLPYCVLLFALMLITGCGSVRTRTGFYEPITVDLKNHSFDAVVAAVDAAKQKNQYGHKDRFLYYVESGLANHYASRFDTSITRFSSAESAAEDLFTKSISRAATSLLLNDNVLEYAGEDYEILYTNIFNCLNFIALDNFEGAFVEVKRANLKLDLLEQKYAKAAEELQRGSPDDTDRVEMEYKAEKVRFHNDAFARYLSMHMYAADGKWDDARIDMDYLRDAFASQSHVYSFPMPNVDYSPEAGKAILSVVGLAGLSPVKEAWDLRIRTDKDLNLVQVLYTDSEGKDVEYGHLPVDIGEDFYFKFSIPRIVQRPSSVSKIRVFANAEPIGELQLIEDVYKVADETFKAKRSLIYTRSVARAIAKGLAGYKLKKDLDTGGFAGWLKKAAVDVATEVSEASDLRCSRLLPGRIYVGDFEIAPGTYDLRIEYFDSANQLLHAKDIPQYKVLDYGLNLVQAVAFR
jgi:hypothetical protein